MTNELSREKYWIIKPIGGVSWCENCQQDTESDGLMPKEHNMPAFKVCWNCHKVLQIGVGWIERYEPA